jgi:isoleucyl-tRNA synthetase
MVAAVIERMDAYDNYTACVRINEFVDALSNWYVRRSRDRFWSADKNAPDKLDAYWTLYECLVTTTKVIAPFVPFLAETLWQNLAGVFGGRAVESVHLCDFPAPDANAVNLGLTRYMSLVREIASLGRAARMESKLKVRQPLARVEVILVDPQQQKWLEEHDALLCDELNVKRIEYATHAEQYIDYHVQPNFPRLGPRLGKLLPHVKQALAETDGAEVIEKLRFEGRFTLELGQERVELDSEDVQIRLHAKPGWAAAQGQLCVVVLSTELTPELVREGLANDVVRLIQERRKELQLEYTDRIDVGIVTESAELQAAIDENRETIMRETLATSLVDKALPNAEAAAHEISSHKLSLYVART